jgi:hypothetical protein
MKSGTVYKNPYTPSHPTYFIYEATMPKRGMESQRTKGYSVSLVDGEWLVGKAEYYKSSLSDFPIVGEIDKPEVIIARALFNAVKPLLDEVKE